MKIEDLHLDQYSYEELDQLYRYIGKLKSKLYKRCFQKKYSQTEGFKEKRKKWDKTYREKKRAEKSKNGS